MIHLLLLLACGKNADDTGTTDGSDATDGADGSDGSGAAACPATDSTLGSEPACAEDYSLCGDVIPPSDYAGTARQIAVALYTSVPPAGPPNAILATIDAPVLAPCVRYPIVIQPMLETGDYFLWVNLYMEGGGEFIPVNDVDYTGATEAPLALDGAPALFPDLNLTLASGW